jgi:hypothetical protein
MVDEEWEIEPGVGVGPARFGLDRSALRAQFGPARVFRRANYSPDRTDQYGADGGLMLTCDPVEGLYLIELAQPSSVTFRGPSCTRAIRPCLPGLPAVSVVRLAGFVSAPCFAPPTTNATVRFCVGC